MRSFRLRSLSHELELRTGKFVIGRSPSCDLALDDALVSRRHALFRVGDTRVFVEDLGSRNGVLINGARINKPGEVKNGDRVTIGSHEFHFVVIDAPDERDGPVTGSFGLTETTNTIAVSPDENEIRRAITLDPDHNETASASLQTILLKVAAKALGLDRADDAGRVAHNLLRNVWEGIGRGSMPADDVLDATTGLLLDLVERTENVDWIDRTFELHAACAKVLEGAAIDRLHDLVRRYRYSRHTPLRSYLSALNSRPIAMTPSERFLLKRLEGLGRVIGPT